MVGSVRCGEGTELSPRVAAFRDRPDILARSTYLRYREALGEDVGPIPEGFYPGEYLARTGAALAARDGARWLGRPEGEWLVPVRDVAVAEMMALIRSRLGPRSMTPASGQP